MASLQDCHKKLDEVSQVLPQQGELVARYADAYQKLIDEGSPLEEQIKCKSRLKAAVKTYDDCTAYIKYATEYVKLDFSQPGAEKQISHLRPEFMVAAGLFLR